MTAFSGFMYSLLYALNISQPSCGTADFKLKPFLYRSPSLSRECRSYHPVGWLGMGAPEGGCVGQCVGRFVSESVSVLSTGLGWPGLLKTV